MNQIRIDVSQDGWTGEKQDIDCRSCGRPLVSKEYVWCGKRFWTTIHDTDGCRDLARRIAQGCAERISPSFRPKEKPTRSVHDDK